MHADGAGCGSFASPAGGLRHCREFRILFENASLFRGKLINAGLACLETRILAPHRHVARSEISLVYFRRARRLGTSFAA